MLALRCKTHYMNNKPATELKTHLTGQNLSQIYNIWLNTWTNSVHFFSFVVMLKFTLTVMSGISKKYSLTISQASKKGFIVVNVFVFFVFVVSRFTPFSRWKWRETNSSDICDVATGSFWFQSWWLQLGTQINTGARILSHRQIQLYIYF